MTSSPRSAKLARLLVLTLALATWATRPAFAQATAASNTAADARALAQYDKNKNGRLDPDELAAKQADEARAASAVATTAGVAAAAKEEVVELSPFQVTASEDRGYAATNTLSGTRLNTSLEDLAGSISVVTKQQLLDTAALDINDIFLYEVGTEGTGQYTETATDGRNEGVWDNVAGNPTGSNRVRGLAAANIAVGGFGSSGTIPIDTYNIESVEISRGSNSTLAGLGEAGGTVNLITSRANVNRESSQIVARVDSYGGFRTSLDLNRPLIRNKLSLRFSAVYNETGYLRKPSVDRTNRQQIAFTARPFKGTTLTGSFEQFHEWANRANSMTPRDSITLWQSRGSPTWDPFARIGKVNGVAGAVGTVPTGINTGFGGGRVLEYIADGRIQLITRGANPNNTTLGLTTTQSMAASSTEAAAGPLFKVSGTTNKAVYDWENVNMAASAYQIQSAKIFNANLDQSFFNTPRNRLDLNVAWRREDQRDYRRQFIGQLDGVGTTLQMDVNERLLDGRPNPFFLRPFIGGVNPQVFRKPVFNDSYRAQLAYQLDLRREKSLLKWLGMHRAIGYGEYKLTVSAPQNLRYHDAIVDNVNFMPATIPPATNLANNNGSLMYTVFFMGDRGDLGLKKANSGPDRYNGKFGAMFAGANSTVYRTDEPVDIEEVYFALDTQKKKVRTFGGSIQSYFFNDQVVTTFGKRTDRVANSANLTVPLVNNFFDETNLWNFGRTKRWRFGDTLTKGVVVKPFRSLGFLKNEAERGSGVTRVLAQALHGSSFYYNKSDSFAPADTAFDLFLRELPNPSGETKELGFGLSMFDSRFSVRVSRQETTQENSRANTSVIATRALGIDFHPGGQTLSFNLYDAATNWEQQLHPTWTQQQVLDAAAKRIGYTPGYVDSANNKVIADVSDAISKGWELELQFNPTRFWTLRATGNKQEAIDANISSTIQEFIALRLPTWTTITIPTDRLPDGSQLADAGALWWTLNQGSQGIPANYYNTNVRNALLPLIAGQGKQKPQSGKYSFNILTNFQLAGLGGLAESHPWMKNVSVGGSYRWASKRAIGYLGMAPEADGVIRTLDKDKPVFGKPQENVDLNLSYRTRLFRNKIGTRFQLNIRTALESGRLEGVAVNPDGRPYQYRIIDPRQFIFTTTFDL
jgi:hypothetical protein